MLADKDNQDLLAEQARDSVLPLRFSSVATEIDCGHGQVVQRKCPVIVDLSLIETAAEWAPLQGLVCIESGTTARRRTKPNEKPATTSPVSNPTRRG